MTFIRLRRLTPFLAAALVLASCGSGNSDPGSAIALTLVSPGVTVQAGGSVQVGGLITRTNFTGAISFALAIPTPGITGSAIAVTNPGGGSGADVNLAVAESVPPGNYQIGVIATASGVSTVSQTFTVTVVTGGHGTPSFFVAPTSNTVTAGSSIDYLVTLLPAGTNDTTAIRVTGLPAGATATLTKSSSILTTLTVATTTAVPSGTDTLAVSVVLNGITLTQTAYLVVSNGSH